MLKCKLAGALGTFVLVGTLWVCAGFAAPYSELQKRRADLFHPDTGLRIAKQRAPTPDDIPAPSVRIETNDVAELIKKDAVLLDVFGALQSRFDELDGTWLVGKKRSSLPGAVWLPETGRGTLLPQIGTYLADNLDKLTGGNKDRAIVVFCVADCWMSWNASQRIAALGYSNVFWFAHGTDGWLESGHQLRPIDPVPVKVD